MPSRNENHTALVKGCLHWLELHKVDAWLNNTGALRDKTGRPVRFGLPGSADILGMMAPWGRIIAIECKTGDGRLSPAQEAFRDMVRRNGGIYLVAREVTDLQALVQYLDVRR